MSYYIRKTKAYNWICNCPQGNIMDKDTSHCTVCFKTNPFPNNSENNIRILQLLEQGFSYQEIIGKLKIYGVKHKTIIGIAKIYANNL